MLHSSERGWAPKLSVVIPTLNEERRIVRAIESAKALSPLEVIVSDGGSVDATVSLATQTGARTLIGAAGRGRQLNAGAAFAQGDIFLFLHADAWLTPDARLELEDALRRRNVKFGAFRQAIEAKGWIYRVLERGNNFRVRWLRVPYGDQAVFVTREAFEGVGGFPDIPIMEDVELARRLGRVGRPALLDGPLHVSARRWKKNGVLRQTLQNWRLFIAWFLGVPPEKLARSYTPHTEIAKPLSDPYGADFGEPTPLQAEEPFPDHA